MQKIIPAQVCMKSRQQGKIKLTAMAKSINENLKKQLNKMTVWFYKYYPVRIKNVGDKEKSERQIIWDFKDGRAYEEVARMTADKLKETFGKGLKDIVFLCVPASTPDKNELRYKKFSERVCELTHACDGYSHISVTEERLTVHEHRNNEKEIRKNNVIEFDTPFFYGKSVILFDDIITKGISYATIAEQLESFGANVLGGFFLAKTFYKIR